MDNCVSFRALNKFVNKLTNKFVNKLANKLVNKLANKLANELVNKLLSKSAGYRVSTLGRFASRAAGSRGRAY